MDVACIMIYTHNLATNISIPNPRQEVYHLKYTKEQRLDIGRRIYEGELSRFKAAEEYNISDQTARNYMRLYRDANNLPPKQRPRSYGIAMAKSSPAPNGMEDLKAMTKEELIDALVMARITEARLKKGYIVEGVGAQRKIIRFVRKNTR